MNFDTIRDYFRNPSPNYLNKELATCYVLHALLAAPSFGTEIIQNLESSGQFRIGDSVLYAALEFLESEDVIEGYWIKVEGRGRPRRMYKINPAWQERSQEFSQLWQQWAAKAEAQANAN